MIVIVIIILSLSESLVGPQMLDSAFLQYAVGKLLKRSASVHLLFAFEYVILASIVVQFQGTSAQSRICVFFLGFSVDRRRRIYTMFVYVVCGKRLLQALGNALLSIFVLMHMTELVYWCDEVCAGMHAMKISLSVFTCEHLAYWNSFFLWTCNTEEYGPCSVWNMM
jgi:hypothetical protein